MADFPVDEAQIVALFMESVFYGLYLVTFGMCMYVMLVKGRSSARQRAVFLAVALAMFAVASLDAVLLLIHVLDAFIWYRGPGGAIGEFDEISYWVNAMKTVTYIIQTSIGDGVLIYRCYIVYGRSWIVVAPLCLLWVGGLVTEIFDGYIAFTLHKTALLNVGELSPFITSLLSITLALNVIATSMIIYKIWMIERGTRDAFALRGSSSLRRAIRIIVESGLLYSLSVVCNMGVYVSGNNALYGVSDCVVQVIGISFNLIIIRIDQGRTVETEYRLQTTTTEGVGKPNTNIHLPRLVFNRPYATAMTTTGVIEKEHIISSKGSPSLPFVSDEVPLQNYARNEILPPHSHVVNSVFLSNLGFPCPRFPSIPLMYS
ncbi:hypothetical protein PHLGIDRAFT_412673 [Phlebiopsis gigantea 11061_1 CR5-6]|uniref:Uncharacterized protein n=1 Tax=Phlebiopsis gigantea (strain 11061_1 CR5-6) TaxID=745531 RepID=A0A0C3SB33_PHLG1|nr:hypothetical protein PHLGIDRAFT_412673 [Phlebiopsis gigantea 11061_1 CR5-6]